MGVVVGTGVACGAFGTDDPGSGGGGGPGGGGGGGVDAEAGTITGNPDPRDAGKDAPTDAPLAKVPARVFVVNALTDMGPFSPNNRPTGGSFRLCYAIAGLGLATRQAMPSIKQAGEAIAGILVGTAYQVRMPVSLEQFEVTPYLVSAEILDSGEIYNTNAAGDDGPKIDCKQLIEDGFVLPTGGDGGKIKLTENVDYWKLDPIPPGTLKNDKTYALVATGCAGDSTNNASVCGAGFTTTGPGRGNMSVSVVELAGGPVPSGSVGLQFIHASAQLNGEGRLARPALRTPDPGGGGPIVVPLSSGTVPYPPVAATPIKQVAGLDIANTTFTVDDNGGVPIADLPLTLGTLFVRDDAYKSPVIADGAAYTIVSLGEPIPAFPGPGGFASPNLRLLHHLIIQNKP